MRTIGIAVVMLAICGALNADPILSVDFWGWFNDGPATPYSVGAPWNNFEVYDTNAVSQTYSPYTVALTGARLLGKRSNTGVGVFDLTNVMRDFFMMVNAGVATVTISGLNANSDYDVDFWHFQNIFVPTASTTVEYKAQGVSLGSLPTTGAAPDSNDDYRTSFTATSDSAGKMVITGHQPGSYTASAVIFNGFQISEHPAPSIPEPGTLMLLGVGTGALGVFGYIRRQRMK